MSLGFLVGCRFDPTDEDIISHYLLGRVRGTLSPIEHMVLKDCDLYKEEPAAIWERLGGKHPEEGVLLFTKLKRPFKAKANGAKKASGSSRFERKVGGDDGGSWHGEDAGSEIHAQTMIDGRMVEVLGRKKRFNFKKEGTDQHRGWIMHEYTLENVDSDDWVVCRLKKNERKRKPDAGTEAPAKKGKHSPPLMNFLTVCPEFLEKRLIQNAWHSVILSLPSGDDCVSSTTFVNTDYSIPELVCPEKASTKEPPPELVPVCPEECSSTTEPTPSLPADSVSAVEECSFSAMVEAAVNDYPFCFNLEEFNDVMDDPIITLPNISGFLGCC